MNYLNDIEILIEKIKNKEYERLEYKKDYMNKSIGIILCKEDNNIVIKYCTDEGILFSTCKINN